jgi:hypothetical protein
MRISFLPFGLLHLLVNGGKKAAQCAGRFDRRFQRLGFTKRDNVCDRILHTKTIGGTLRAQQFYLRSPEVGNQSRDSRLSKRFIVQHLQPHI